MDRRYYRKYENYDTVVPRVEDFPILNSDNKINAVENETAGTIATKGFKNDDMVLLVVLVVLLMGEEKDAVAIFSIAALLLVEYIF